MSAPAAPTQFRVTFYDGSGAVAAVGFELKLLVDHVAAATTTVGPDGVATLDASEHISSGSQYAVRMKHRPEANGHG